MFISVYQIISPIGESLTTNDNDLSAETLIKYILSCIMVMIILLMHRDVTDVFNTLYSTESSPPTVIMGHRY